MLGEILAKALEIIATAFSDSGTTAVSRANWRPTDEPNQGRKSEQESTTTTTASLHKDRKDETDTPPDALRSTMVQTTVIGTSSHPFGERRQQP